MQCKECGERESGIDLLFGPCCEACGDATSDRAREWFEVGGEPIRTIGDLDLFMSGACLVYGTPAFRMWHVQKQVFDRLPEECVSIVPLFHKDGCHLEIKQPIPATVVRRAIVDTLNDANREWQNANRQKSQG